LSNAKDQCRVTDKIDVVVDFYVTFDNLDSWGEADWAAISNASMM
jgi:hypothetical protein